MIQACKLAFSVGFKRCREKAWMYLSIDNIKLLRMDLPNESLRAMIDHCLEKSVSASDGLVGTNKIHSVTQTEEANVEEG